MGVSINCPILGVPPDISTNFKFCRHIQSKEKFIKISGKVPVGIVRDSRKFSWHSYIWGAYRAVIFAIARLSCF